MNILSGVRRLYPNAGLSTQNTVRFFTVKQKQYADKSPCMLLVTVLSLFRCSVFSQCPWSVFLLPWCLYTTCSLRPFVSATLLEILVISTLPQVQSGHQDTDVHTHTQCGEKEKRGTSTQCINMAFYPPSTADYDIFSQTLIFISSVIQEYCFSHFLYITQ